MGPQGKGAPLKRTWMKVVRIDLKKYNLLEDLAQTDWKGET